MLALLASLREKCAIGFVGGSNLVKQQEQLGSNKIDVVTLFDWCFAENGLTAYKLGEPLPSNSFIEYIGEEPYKQLVNFCLRYVADLEVPVKRGTFVEFRNGMINVSPVGRNASVEERNAYEKYDLEHKIREKFVAALKEKFGHLGLTYVHNPHACAENTDKLTLARATASPSAARFPSTSSPPAGTRPTASSTSRARPRTAASSTRRSTSSATRPSPAATTTRSTATPAPSATPSRDPRTATSRSRSCLTCKGCRGRSVLGVGGR